MGEFVVYQRASRVGAEVVEDGHEPRPIGWAGDTRDLFQAAIDAALNHNLSLRIELDALPDLDGLL